MAGLHVESHLGAAPERSLEAQLHRCADAGTPVQMRGKSLPGDAEALCDLTDRYALGEILTEDLAAVRRAVQQAGLKVASGARTGAVTLIQRFGSALNLNVYLHMPFLDGAYAFRGSGAAFNRARRPSDAELTELLETLSRRIVRLLERRGLLIADPECPVPDFEASSSLNQLQTSSVN